MTDLKNYTLLLVDDDVDLLEVMHLTFENQGFHVLTASNGNEALEVIKKNPIDLILSDMRMPNGDGMSLLEGVKKVLPQMPILYFVTGFSEVSVVECIAKGARGVFTKPFNPAELVSTVKMALGVSPLPQAI